MGNVWFPKDSRRALSRQLGALPTSFMCFMFVSLKTKNVACNDVNTEWMPGSPTASLWFQVIWSCWFKLAITTYTTSLRCPLAPPLYLLSFWAFGSLSSMHFLKLISEDFHRSEDGSDYCYYSGGDEEDVAGLANGLASWTAPLAGRPCWSGEVLIGAGRPFTKATIGRTPDNKTAQTRRWLAEPGYASYGLTDQTASFNKIKPMV